MVIKSSPKKKHVLTSHQKEVLKERRSVTITDIMAKYHYIMEAATFVMYQHFANMPMITESKS